MLQMSTRLPLTEASATPNGVPFAFASGLVVQGNTVVVSGLAHKATLGPKVTFYRPCD